MLFSPTFLQIATEQCVKAVIMTPTKELCSQASRNIQVSIVSNA